jgi:hypothetical protein
MLFLKYLLMTGGVGMILIALGILAYDLTMELQYRRAMAGGVAPLPAIPKLRWRTTMALAMLAWAPILIALSIVVIPRNSGACVRAQERGWNALSRSTLSLHCSRKWNCSTRDQLFTTDQRDEDGAGTPKRNLNVQAKEGLTWAWPSRCDIGQGLKRPDYVGESAATG